MWTESNPVLQYSTSAGASLRYSWVKKPISSGKVFIASKAIFAQNARGVSVSIIESFFPLESEYKPYDAGTRGLREACE